MDDKEHLYDTKVSPLVRQLLAVCEEHGIPMFATFQFSDTGFCTSAREEQGHPLIRHMRALSQCARGNGVDVDRYMNWVAKAARVEGHGSIYLLKAGVPLQPAAPEEAPPPG
jgi:hypothetical protein